MRLQKIKWIAKERRAQTKDLGALRKIVEVTMMNYKLEYKKACNYVFLLFIREMDIDEARACRHKVREVLLAYKLTKVLVDLTRLTAKLSVIEDYEFTKEMRWALPSGISVALVVPAVWKIDGRFIEQVAGNNGVRLRSFTKKADSVAWLMKQA